MLGYSLAYLSLTITSDASDKLATDLGLCRISARIAEGLGGGGGGLNPLSSLERPP